MVMLLLNDFVLSGYSKPDSLRREFFVRQLELLVPSSFMERVRQEIDSAREGETLKELIDRVEGVKGTQLKKYFRCVCVRSRI